VFCHRRYRARSTPLGIDSRGQTAYFLSWLISHPGK
jgi:hypothetical protein